MRKAILIVDISDELLKEYKDFAVEYYLIATSKEDPLWRDCVRFVGETELKPMPTKMSATANANLDLIANMSREENKIYNVGYTQGRNTCIDEMMGEEE